MSSPSPDLDAPLSFEGLFSHLNKRLATLHTLPTLPNPATLTSAIFSLPENLPEKGLGASEAVEFVEKTVLPALAPGHSGPRFVPSECF